jgi:hypothetical protein
MLYAWMIHIQCFPKFCKDKTWTIYAPKLGANVPLDQIAKYVHTTFRRRIEERKSEFLIGFIPEDQLNEGDITPVNEFDWDGYHYIVVTKEIEKVFLNLPDLVNVDDHITVFVTPHLLHAEVQTHDVVNDAQRMFFFVAIGILLMAWFFSYSVNK